MTNKSLTNLSVSYYNIPPYNIIGPDNVTLGPSLMKSILDYLTVAMNLNVTVVLPKEREHGRRMNGTGKWSGVIGVIYEQAADIGMLPFGISYVRHTAMSFSTPFYYSYAGILSSEPDTGKDNFAFLKNLPPEVWCLLLMTVLLVSLLFYIFGLIRSSKDEYMANKPKSFMYYFLDFYGTVFGQSTNFDSSEFHESVLLGFWWMFRITLLTTYAGTLTASFAYTEFKKLDTLTDLLEKSKLTVYVQKNSAFQDYFQNSPFSEPQALYKRITKRGSNLAVPELQNNKTFSDIILGKSVMIHEVLSLNRITASHCAEGTKFYQSDEPIFWVPLAIGIRKNLNANLSEVLNLWVTRYTSMKLLSPHLLKMQKDALPCRWEKPESSSVAALEIYDVLGVFFVFFIGICLSAITFIWEICFLRKGNENKYS